MKVILSTRDRKLVIDLPIVPSDITWGKSMNNQVMETMSNGEILLPGQAKLREISISSFLPSNKDAKYKYPYVKNYFEAEGVIYQFEEWRDTHEPIRVIFISKDGRTLLNDLFLICGVERGKDKASDVPYTLDLKQYVPLQ